MKVAIIKQNSDRYSISAMCNVLNIPRSTYYYESKIEETQPDEFTEDVKDALKANRKAYGTR